MNIRCAFCPRSSEFFWLALASTLILGCGPAASERALVHGTVNLDGKPLPGGEIRFVPIEGTLGPAWSAMIQDGAYTTAGTTGVPVGKLRIEFKAFRTAPWYNPSTPSPIDDTAAVPTVQYLSNELNISTGYLSDILRSLIGKNAQQYIHEKLIEKAKEKLITTELTISEIAYELGFEHPQSFSKIFKTKTNLSPLEFRKSFN